MHEGSWEASRVKAVRSINNNIAVCEDSAGNELIAMGKGIGYGRLPREVSLDEITSTFYNVDVESLTGISGVPMEVLAFADGVANRARNELPYQLSPNLVFTLADHIAFALKRARENMSVSMPLAFDVEQSYPAEYRIARQTVRRLRKEFLVALRDDEAAGIALNIVNSKMTEAGAEERARAQGDEDMLEDVTEIIENSFGMTIDCATFAYSRYATHMNYLFRRLHDGESLGGKTSDIYADVRSGHPDIEECVGRIAGHLSETWGSELSDEERLYVFVHVGRLRAKEQSN